jgi:hypothetical protein
MAYTSLWQKTLINVIPTKREGLDHDIVKVQTTFKLDQALPDGEVLFVPSKKEKIPDEVLSLLNPDGKFDFGPKFAKDITPKLADFGAEVADPTRTAESRQDALLGLFLTYQEQVKNLTPIVGNVYTLSYEFPLYPNRATNEFEFNTTIPLAGLATAGNFELELIIVLPNNVTFDPKETKGITLNGQEIVEQPFLTQGRTNIITFYQKQDPSFFVVYHY